MTVTVDGATICFDSDAESTTIFFPPHACRTTCVDHTKSNVFVVLQRNSFPQVSPRVVQLVTVNMVNMIFRKGSCHVEKSKTVKKIPLSINTRTNITIGIKRTDNPITTTRTTMSPRKITRFRVIRDDFNESFLVNHAVFPLPTFHDPSGMLLIPINIVLALGANVSMGAPLFLPILLFQVLTKSFW